MNRPQSRGRPDFSMAQILLVGYQEMDILVRGVLQPAGHEVRCAAAWSPATEALNAAQPPQIILTNVFRPGDHGLGLLQSLRDHFRHVPIIALAARPLTFQEKELAEVQGATRLVEEGQAFSTLPALINTLLRGALPPGAVAPREASESDTPPAF